MGVFLEGALSVAAASTGEPLASHLPPVHGNGDTAERPHANGQAVGENSEAVPASGRD